MIPSRILAAAALGLLLSGSAAQGDRIRWVRDHDEGRRIARETGRPLMVVFR